MIRLRNYGLDILRILLCLSVTMYHYGNSWSCSGGCGVDGFFVLAGFLAVYSEQWSPTKNPWHYYRNKAWRLFPVLLFVVAFSLLSTLFLERLGFHFTGASELSDSAPIELTIGATLHNVPIWFIICYLIFILIIPWFYRCYKCKAFYWLLGAAFLFALLRSGTKEFAERDSGGLYFQCSFRLWQFMTGMWCVSWKTEKWSALCRWSWIFIMLLWLLASNLISNHSVGYLNYSFPCYVISTSIFALGISSLWNTSLRELTPPTLKRLTLAAGMTYAFYLIHNPVMRAVDKAFNRFMPSQIHSQFLLIVAALLCTTVLSYLIHVYFEQRFFAKRQPRR